MARTLIRSNHLFTKSRADLETAYNPGPGRHWFDPKTLRFFKSRISDIYYVPNADAWLFISSEQGPHGPRAYTVRAMNAAGNIRDVGKFKEHPTLGQARTALKRVTPAALVDLFNPAPAAAAARYPIAESDREHAPRGSMLEDTGETRPPRAGDWFLSGAVVEGYKAVNDQTAPERIARIVKG